MRAMVMTRVCDLTRESDPLQLVDLPDPSPGPSDLLLKVLTCGVCHTELDEIEGRTPPPKLPVIPGHQVVGRVVETGENVTRFKEGERVGVAWIYSSCGECFHCRGGYENLCGDFLATGRDADGGYAEYMVVPETSVSIIPDLFSDLEAAPLLCAGAIGFRSLTLSGIKDGEPFGLTGFGASAHLVLKLARHTLPNSDIFVFARSEKERTFARELGAVWAGDTEERSPERLAAIIDTTPAWKPVVEALINLRPGGRLVINAIRKEDVDREVLLTIRYPDHLWMEKEIKSVANVTRADVQGFLLAAAEVKMKPEVQAYALTEANRALLEIKQRRIRGAKVLRIND